MRVAHSRVVAAALTLSSAVLAGFVGGLPAAGIALGATAAAPFDYVAVTGVPADLDPAGLMFRISTVGGPVDLPVISDEAGLRVLVPPLPATPFDGGILDLTVVADGLVGPTVRLELAALRPVPLRGTAS